jgi:hypothetical protein
VGGSPYAWIFLGPEADLTDCNNVVVGKHFASGDAGAGFPEWKATDGTYVIGQKALAYTPVGRAGSLPWLSLNALATGGRDGGTLRLTQYIERLHSDGGNAPTAESCGSASRGVTQKVPYTADYYFLAP